MALKIKANTFFTHRYIVVKKDCVKFCESSIIGGRKTFRFNDIQCVLISPNNELSFQVNREVFTLKVNPAKPSHQKTIQALIEGIRQTI